VYTDLVLCEKPHRRTSPRTPAAWGLTPPTPRIRTIHYTKIAGRPGSPAFLTFVAGLLRSNRGASPRSPLSGVLTPPDPPNELIDKPVEPVASPSPELDRYAILLATVTTPLTWLSNRTFWRGLGEATVPQGRGFGGQSLKGRISKDLCVHSSFLRRNSGLSRLFLWVD
jgi:hypothetical protein